MYQKLYIRPLLNDFPRKKAKFQHQASQDVSLGTRIRFFMVKLAAMIFWLSAVTRHLEELGIFSIRSWTFRHSDIGQT